jgi:hypothetical protein
MAYSNRATWVLIGTILPFACKTPDRWYPPAVDAPPQATGDTGAPDTSDVEAAIQASSDAGHDSPASPPGSIPADASIATTDVHLVPVPSADASEAMAPTTPPPAPPAEPNRIFVTSLTYTANLGGLAGADAKCQERALAGGLSGRFVALLSTSTVSAFSRLSEAAGWVRTDGKPFGNAAAELRSGRIFYPPTMDERGNEVPATSGSTFTGTTYQGDYDAGRTANDWATPPLGTAWTCSGGDVYAGGKSWFSFWTGGSCNSARLLCFEVSRRSDVTPRLPPGMRIAFASTEYLPGGGPEGADRHCATDATTAGLAGTFKALLATAAGPAITRVDLGGTPWWRPDGVQVVAKASDIAGLRLLAPIAIQANGIG